MIKKTSSNTMTTENLDIQQQQVRHQFNDSKSRIIQPIYVYSNLRQKVTSDDGESVVNHHNHVHMHYELDPLVFTLYLIAITTALSIFAFLLFCFCLKLSSWMFSKLPLSIQEYLNSLISSGHLDRSSHICACSRMTIRAGLGYAVGQVEIQTCGLLYEKCKRKKTVHVKDPSKGLKLMVEYADTKYTTPTNNNTNESIHDWDHAPTVLALHGAPGSHQDFAPLIKYLSKHGARVIAPNFPDYSLTIKTDGVWRHSAEEKAQYIKDFLDAIGVSKIDMLLSHSSAIYPSLILWASGRKSSSTPSSQDSNPQVVSGLQVDAIGLFNPGGHRRIKGMKPVWFIEGGVKAYQTKLWRFVFNTFGTSFLTITKAVTVKPDNMHNVMLSAISMMYSGYRELEPKLVTLKDSNLPLLYVFSENDRLIEREIFLEMGHTLGVEEENMSHFNEAGDKIRTGKDTGNRNIKAISFSSGGHYAFLKYIDVINDATLELLNRSMKKQKEEKELLPNSNNLDDGISLEA